MHEKLLSAIDVGKDKYGNYAALSRASGISEANISRWRKGTQTPRISDYAPLLEAVNAQLIFPGESVRNLTLIPKTTAKAGAGSSYEVEDETSGLYAFRSEYLGLRHISEKNAILVEVSGDSMDPTLKNGDTILVDKSDIEIMDGHIYLVGFQGQLLIKRLSLTVSGLRLKSDNPVYSPIDIPREYADDFVVFGKMRWMCRDF